MRFLEVLPQTHIHTHRHHNTFAMYFIHFGVCSKNMILNEVSNSIYSAHAQIDHGVSIKRKRHALCWHFSLPDHCFCYLYFFRRFALCSYTFCLYPGPWKCTNGCDVLRIYSEICTYLENFWKIPKNAFFPSWGKVSKLWKFFFINKSE